MRTLSSFEQLLATTDDEGIQLHQFASGTVSAELPTGRVELRLETDYPWDGHIAVTVVETPDQPWTLGLRIPEWCRAWGLRVGGEQVDAEARDGRVSLERGWASGDEVELDLSMPARLTAPDPRIDAVRGTLAVERGPLVYCLEEADLPGDVDLADVAIDPAVAPTPGTGRHPELGTRPVAISLVHRRRPRADWPYVDSADQGGAAARAGEVEAEPERLDLEVQPYFAWANRGDGAMRIWIPRADLP
jgi:hypothetical protein